MANPQKENGYTAIANEIIDHIAKTQLNSTQFRIVMVIWRYTYGFSRKEHEFSETFLSNTTGISKRQIRRELTELINKRIIEVVRNATFSTPRVLQFNKNYEEWVVDKVSISNDLSPEDGLTPEDEYAPEDKLDLSPEDRLVHTSEDKIVPSPEDRLDPQENNIKTNIKTNTTATTIAVTETEEKILKTLQQIGGWPYDLETDISHIRKLILDYPEINMLDEVKKFRDWHLDKPLKKNSNPRLQLRNWCIKAKEFMSRRKGESQNGRSTSIQHNTKTARDTPAGGFKELD